jgi:SAM-dependent methyltransferase
MEKPALIHGIPCYKPNITENYHDYHVSGLHALYEAEKNHFWFITRRTKIVTEIKNTLPFHSTILEIGAGTGYVARALMADYDVSVGDIHLSGLLYAQQYGIKKCYQFDLFDPPFQHHFDAISIFDVLEHLESDHLALSKINNMLKPNGFLFITVPAHPALWSREDKIANHKRRYTKRSLEDTVCKANFNIIKSEYFFKFILPLLYIRKLLNPDTNNPISESERYKPIMINPVINTLLLRLTQIEFTLNPILPNLGGGSIFLVAQKGTL